MTIAVIGAFAIREWEEAVIIVVLFSLGEALEAYGVQSRSRSSAARCIHSKTAQLKGSTDRVSVEDVKPGEIIVVSSGDQIPLDGEIVRGRSLVDEATITGEPLPRSRISATQSMPEPLTMMDILRSGSRRLLRIRRSQKSFISRTSQPRRKHHRRSLLRNFPSTTPAVMFGAVLLVLIPVFIFGKPFTPWFTQALTLRHLLSVCARNLHSCCRVLGDRQCYSAVSSSKEGNSSRAMGKIKTIAFDKTRTLTKGEPIVSDVVAFNGYSKEEVLAYRRHGSPLEASGCRSITTKAEDLKLDIHVFENFQSVMGKGLKEIALYAPISTIVWEAGNLSRRTQTRR